MKEHKSNFPRVPQTGGTLGTCAKEKKPKILVPKRTLAGFFSTPKTSKEKHVDWLGRLSPFKEIVWVNKIKTLSQRHPYLCFFRFSSQIPFQLTNRQEGRTNKPTNPHLWTPLSHLLWVRLYHCCSTTRMALAKK